MWTDLDAYSAQHESVADAYRLRRFKISMMFIMQLKMVTIFVLVSSFARLGPLLGVSSNTALLLPAVYELGKLIGSCVFGVLGARVNMIVMMKRSVECYVVLALLMVCIFTSLDQQQLKAAFPVYAIVYFFISLLSLSTQWGLSVLKLTSADTEEYKRWVSYQSAGAGWGIVILSLLGGYLVFSVGPFFPWVFLAAYGLVMRVLLEVYGDVASEQCQPNAQVMTGVCRAVFNHLESCGAALSHPDTKRFRAFCLAVGLASSVQYALPATVSAMFQGRREGQQALDDDAVYDSAQTLAIMMMGSAVGRSAVILLVKHFRCEEVLRTGLALMTFSLVTMFVFGRGQGILVPGVVLFFGVGLAMPAAKIGAMLAVPTELNSTGVQLIKLAQLLFGLFPSVLGALVFNGTARPLTGILVGLVAVGAIVVNWGLRVSPTVDLVLESSDDVYTKMRDGDNLI